MSGQIKTANRGYDIIGDIHGCAHTLIHLLEQMGYRKVNGIYEHPRRQAIFICGVDIIRVADDQCAQGSCAAAGDGR